MRRLMKIITFLTLLVSTTAFANIPLGTYKVDKIQCKTGKQLKLGGKFMVYSIMLEVKETEMIMTAKAKSGSWAPFRLNCTQLNRGKYVYTQEGKYEGELPNISASCNNSMWTNILKKRLFGVEEYGVFNYKVNGNKLEVYNADSVTKYSCEAVGDYPVYYYTRH